MQSVSIIFLKNYSKPLESFLAVLLKLILAGLIICYPIANVTAQSDSTEKPNLVIILLDDLGYADVGFNGSTEIFTPNIDRIAKNGVRITRGYVTHAVCAPSRAGLITGRYQDRFGASRNPLFAPKDSTQGLPLSEETLADALGRSGYTSSIIGKWHLGAHESLYPLNRGFDEFFGFLSGGHHYFPEEWTIRDKTEARAQWDGYRTRIMRNNGRVVEHEYLTDALLREAADFVERHAEQTPFFLFLSYNAPHTPMQATEKYLSRFDHIDDEKRRTYAAMISAVDDGVGDLYETLDRHGLTENTLIFFLSDNGGPTFDNASDNSPLRGFKGDFYEGGVRVPYAVSWPAVLPKNLDYDKPVSSLDIFATSVAHAGAEPSNKPDGVDLVPFLTGENSDQPHKALFWRNSDRDWIAMATHNYKYLNLTENTVELYNLTKDIAEEYNISIEKFEKFQEYVALPEEWESGLISPVYLGLLQNNQYNQENPDRFQMTSIYEPDTSPPSVPEGYELVWSDEFNSDGVPDERWWNFEHGFVRNNELQWYQPGNARIEDGRLIFKGKRERIKNSNYDSESSDWRKNREYAEYTSASINTRDKFSFQYGIMEVRARVDTTLGAWPAIWTLGNDRQWPERGEVDVMEFYRIADEPTILANAAWVGDSRWDVVWDSEKIPLSDYLEKIPDWPERFHTWKMNWSEEYIKLYLNDELLNKVEIENATYDDGFNPFRQPHYILLNLAIGSNGGNPEKSEFPISYEVDFVRVYQEKKAETN